MLLETIIGLHLYTYHFDRKVGLNDQTPGAYVALHVDDSPCMPSAGYYRNSESGNSVWAGCTFQYSYARLTVGVVGGYKSGSTLLVIPSVAIPVTQKTNFTIGYVPDPNRYKNSSDGVHFTIEYKF